jgi:Na+-transporting NADH:ubiquinone oxidoreductase subunit NqrC
VGKTIFDEQGNFAPIKAVKGGAADDDMHGVDAISGGTITSNGLSLMIENTLKIYTDFLKGVQQPVVEEMTVAVADSLAVDSLMVDSLNVEVTQ